MPWIRQKEVFLCLLLHVHTHTYTETHMHIYTHAHVHTHAIHFLKYWPECSLENANMRVSLLLMASHWFGGYNKNSQNNLKKIMIMTDPICLFSLILCSSGHVSLTPSVPAPMAGIQTLKHAKPFTTCFFFLTNCFLPRITWCDQLHLSFQPQLTFLKETVSNFPTWDDPFPLIHSIPVWAQTLYNRVKFQLPLPQLALAVIKLPQVWHLRYFMSCISPKLENLKIFLVPIGIFYPAQAFVCFCIALFYQ